MLYVNEGRGPCSSLRIIAAQVCVYLAFLTRTRRIDDPKVLNCSPIHNPTHYEFTRAVSYFAVLRKVGVFDIPGSDKMVKDFCLVAERRVRTSSLERRNHV